MIPIELPSMAEFIDVLADAAAEAEAPESGAVYVSEMVFDLPFELDLYQEEGAWRIAAGPPTQKLETTVMPVWHRMRATVKVDHGEHGPEGLEA